MTLRETIEKYRALAGGFGRPVRLADFGMDRAETERLFASLEEDYHISRFVHFTLAAAATGAPEETFQISGFPQSHVLLDAGIEQLL